MKTRNVPYIVAVASGKGGVGKTTIATDMARTASAHGYSVGLIDGDISTPNSPEVIGGEGVDIEDQRLATHDSIVPPVVDGIQIVSQGIDLPDDVPLLRGGVWRAEAVADYLGHVEWKEGTDLIVVDTPPGCLVTGTPVWTKNGPKPIEQIAPGEKVWSFGGEMSNQPIEIKNNTPQLREVKNVVDSGKQEVYEVTTSTRTIEGTGDHPVLVASHDGRGDYGLSWKGLAELSEKDQVLCTTRLPDGTPAALPDVDRTGRGRRLNEVDVPDVASEDLCRLVGYFLGDGSIKDSGGDYGVWFAEDDAALVDKYSEILERLFGVEPSVNERSSGDHGGVKFGLYRKRVALLFKKMGLSGGTHGVSVPGWVFQEPESHRRACLEGFIDADGHRRQGTYPDGTRRDGNSGIGLANEWLAQSIRHLAISVGEGPNNLRSREREIPFDHGRDGTVTHWEFDIVSAKARADGGPSKGTPKYRGSSLIRSNGADGLPGLDGEYWGFDSVQSVEKTGVKRTWDLTVEGNHNYLADGMVVHNTGEELQVIVSELPLDHAFVVSTPHPSSVRDATKTHEFFEQAGVPHKSVLNMAYIPKADVVEHVLGNADFTEIDGVAESIDNSIREMVGDAAGPYNLFGWDGKMDSLFGSEVIATVPYTEDFERRREVYEEVAGRVFGTKEVEL